MKTIPKTYAKGFMYEKVRDREYLIQRQALLGIFRWDEVVRTDRISSELILYIATNKRPEKVFVNEIEYVPKKLLLKKKSK